MTEKTTALTDAMIKALATLADSTGQPVELKNSSVIDALLQRKFVLHTNPTAHLTYPKTYFITPSGRIALAISTKGKSA